MDKESVGSTQARERERRTTVQTHQRAGSRVADAKTTQSSAAQASPSAGRTPLTGTSGHGSTGASASHGGEGGLKSSRWSTASSAAGRGSAAAATGPDRTTTKPQRPLSSPKPAPSQPQTTAPAPTARPPSSFSAALSRSATLSSSSSPASRARHPPSPTAAKKLHQVLSPRSSSHRRHTSSDVPQATPTPPASSSPSLPAATPAQPPRPATSHSPHSSSPSSSNSPGKNRFPARFSSNGIATSAGPPPALAYRRKLSMDGRGSYSSRDAGYSGGVGNRSSASSSTISAQQVSRSNSVKARPAAADASRSRRNSLRADRENNDYNDQEMDGDRTIRGLEDLAKGAGKLLDPAPVERGSDEDVFLKLARTGTAPQKSERRRARLSQYSHHRASLPLDHISSPLHDPVPQSAPLEPMDSSPPLVSDDVWRRTARMSSPSVDYRSRRMSNASNYSDHPDDSDDRISVSRRTPVSRGMSVLRNEHSPGVGHTRSYSLAEPAIIRSRTGLGGLTNGVSPRTLRSSLHHDDRTHSDILEDYPPSLNHVGRTASSGGPDDSASSASTTAQSSVWDELDDLKSRIKRLELTGKLPASGRGGGHGSNSSGDRPRTATTTVTTISSSPRRNNVSGSGPSPPDSTVSAAGPTNHPLLHSALAKTKSLVHPDVYKHLEVAANDALALAGAVGVPGSGTSGSLTSDRHIRRKADSVCRSITELCLSLSEHRNSFSNHLPHLQQQSNASTSRPVSRDATRDSMLAGRESVLGDRSVLGDKSVLGDRSTARERAYHRLAERRGSVVSLSTNTAGYSPRLQESVTTPTASGTLRQRPSMLLKSRSPVTDDEEYDFRAPSRATAELNTHRSPRDRHSLAPERSATIGHNSTVLPPRRQYVSNTMTNSASSPGISTGRRFFSHSHTMEPSPSADRTFDLGNPRNERLMAAAAADSDYTTTRLRSGSLGRAGSSRMRRELRESVDLGSPRVSASDRLLSRR